MIFFLFADLFILEALLHLLMEKRNKRKRKAIIYALSSYRFAQSKKKKKRFADSCGWLTMQLAFCCKVYWVPNHLCSRWRYISSLKRDILHSATLPSVLLVEVLKEGLYSQVAIGMVGSCILLGGFISRSHLKYVTLQRHVDT